MATQPKEQEYVYQVDQQVSVNGSLDVDIEGETVRFQVTSRYGSTAEKIVKVTDAAIEAFKELRKNYPRPVLQPAPASEPVMAQVYEPATGLPLVDENQQPVKEKIDGANVYTVEGVSHGTTQSGKDVLCVFTVEKEEFISRKYGVKCFHAPAIYKDFKNWPVDTKYGPKEGGMKVVIRAPKGDSKYADVVEFRA
ncbi:MAG: hypothetical protein EHM33_00850 [Chloroflexi bacterium]|nr:MAG: hypothetical protein EHM33_00850 [Chloroflexota bacterium]